MKTIKPVLAILVFSFAMNTMAQTANEKAWRLHNRIAGVPPQQGALNLMVQEINQNSGRAGFEKAAAIAIQNDEFYNTVLKQLFKPMTNISETTRVALDDMSATLIGAVRDSDTKPFNRVLFEDVVYVGPSLGRTGGTNKQRVDDGNRRKYQVDNNTHYATIESSKLNLQSVLVERQISSPINTESFTGTYVADNGNTVRVTAEASEVMVNGVNGSAGILTTGSFARDFYEAGTNRRAFRFVAKNFLCNDMEALHDNTLPDFRIRQDVDRAPGGDSRVFIGTCKGCHSIMGPNSGAMAYYDENRDHVQFTPGTVRPKYLRDPIYSDGYVTTDDSWINTMTQGKNAALGWRGPTSGNGLKDWGQMIAKSRGFSECMAKRVFKHFCYRASDENDKAFISQMATEFEGSDNYDFKKLVVKTSAKCIEDEYEN